MRQCTATALAIGRTPLFPKGISGPRAKIFLFERWFLVRQVRRQTFFAIGHRGSPLQRGETNMAHHGIRRAAPVRTDQR